MIVQDDLIDRIEGIRSELPVHRGNFVHFGGTTTPHGYQSYEMLIDKSAAQWPAVEVLPEDPWAFMYTSGTSLIMSKRPNIVESYMVLFSIQNCI